MSDACFAPLSLRLRSQDAPLHRRCPPSPPPQRSPARPRRRCAPSPHGPTRTPASSTGVASWYQATRRQARTASGRLYRANALTAAHPFLPFGTKVRVTDLENDRSVIVRIDDRGPFVPGRVIDLSVAAAQRLGIRHSGVSRVRLLAVPEGTDAIPSPIGLGPLPSCAPNRGAGRA